MPDSTTIKLLPHAPAAPAARAVATPAAVPVALPATEPAFEDLIPAGLRLHCRLRLTAEGTGLNTLLTGLSMLEREGRVALELDVRAVPAPLDHGPTHLRDKAAVLAELEVAGGGTALIDQHDSWEVDEAALAHHDLCFKRSFAPHVLLLPGGDRIRTLGLLTDVRPDGFDRHELVRLLGMARGRVARLRTIAHWFATALGARFELGSRPAYSSLIAPPAREPEARVLLMGRLWDPDRLPPQEVELRAAWEAINRQRVACVRALRRALGPRFTGGIQPDEFAQRYAPDVLLPSTKAASPQAFRAQLRSHAICVTSTGLHGSNGFRLAEYVAASRAIVTEPLRYRVPGDFRAEHNYLEFTTSDECVERCLRLLEHPAERIAMMERNQDYYRYWLRPDRLALRVVALTWAAGRRRVQLAASAGAAAAERRLLNAASASRPVPVSSSVPGSGTGV